MKYILNGGKMEIKSRFDHFNFNVFDLEKSMTFYKDAFGLKEAKRVDSPDGSYVLVYLGEDETDFLLELTWLRDRKEPYNLGDLEYHLCIRVAGDYDVAKAYHKEMGCVCFENEELGLYFVSDPDGYWIEVLEG